MESILTSIKKLLGIDAAYTRFDTDIIIHINSVFMDLTQLGVGPIDGFVIEDDTSEWTDFVDDTKKLQAIKSYIYLRVKLLFDPPTSSTVIEAMNRDIQRYEWWINAASESSSNGLNKADLDRIIELINSEVDKMADELRSEFRQGGGIVKETDPTVPSWAKQPKKPTYSYGEIKDTPTLGALAKKDNISYEEVKGTPTLGALAKKDDISYEEIKDAPTLGALAKKDDISYEEVEGTPTLGALAEKDSISYEEIVGKPDFLQEKDIAELKTSVAEVVEASKQNAEAIDTLQESTVLKTEVGAANGIASLDGDGKLPKSQLPDDIPTTGGMTEEEVRVIAEQEADEALGEAKSYADEKISEAVKNLPDDAGLSESEVRVIAEQEASEALEEAIAYTDEVIANLPSGGSGGSGVADAETIARVTKNEQDIVNLYSIVESAIVTKTTVSDSFSQRPTANGLAIIDGTYTSVNKVIGNSVTVKENAEEDGVITNAYFQGIRCESPNLFNPNNLIAIEPYGWGIVSSATTRGVIIPCKPNTTYSISFSKSTSDRRITIFNHYPKIGEGPGIGMTTGFIIDDPERPSTDTYYFNYNKKPYFITKSDTQYIAFCLGKDSEISGNEIMINEGEPMPYVAPHEPSEIKFPNPIEIGTGTVIDISNQKVINGYVEYVFDGSEKWEDLGTIYSLYRYSCNPSDFFLEMMSGEGQVGFCTRFEPYYGQWHQLSNTCIRFGQSNKSIYLLLEEYLTVADVKELVKGMKIRYPLATPTETPFTTTQKAAGNSYRGYVGGKETVLGNKNEETVKGTVEQIYYVAIGG